MIMTCYALAGCVCLIGWRGIVSPDLRDEGEGLRGVKSALGFRVGVDGDVDVEVVGNGEGE